MQSQLSLRCLSQDVLQLEGYVPVTAQCIRCDPNGLEHASFVDEYGVFHYVQVDAACGAITSLARFQLFFNETPDDPSAARPSERTWHSFEFVHKLPGDIIFFQQRSNRILYTSMPISTSEPSAVCLFGAHTASISVMKHNNSVLLSGSEDGSAKMWRLSDGQLLDTLVEPYTCSITAIEFVGPLLAAMGTSFGSVSITDLTTNRMMVVQRISCGDSPVSHLAASVTPAKLAQVATAAGPRAADGAGVLHTPVGLAWEQQEQGRRSSAVQGDAAMLVVTTQASSIRVFQAQHPGEAAWVQTASTTLPGSITGLGLTGNITGSIAGQHIILQLSPDPGPPSELSHTSPGHILLMDITTCSTAHRWHVLGAPRSTQLLPSSGIRLVTADIGHLQQLLEVQLLTCTAVGGMCVLTARLPFPAEEQEGAGQVESADDIVLQLEQLEQLEHHIESSQQLAAGSAAGSAADADALWSAAGAADAAADADAEEVIDMMETLGLASGPRIIAAVAAGLYDIAEEQEEQQHRTEQHAAQHGSSDQPGAGSSNSSSSRTFKPPSTLPGARSWRAGDSSASAAQQQEAAPAHDAGPEQLSATMTRFQQLVNDPVFDVLLVPRRELTQQQAQPNQPRQPQQQQQQQQDAMPAAMPQAGSGQHQGGPEAFGWRPAPPAADPLMEGTFSGWQQLSQEAPSGSPDLAGSRQPDAPGAAQGTAHGSQAAAEASDQPGMELAGSRASGGQAQQERVPLSGQQQQQEQQEQEPPEELRSTRQYQQQQQQQQASWQAAADDEPVPRALPSHLAPPAGAQAGPAPRNSLTADTAQAAPSPEKMLSPGTATSICTLPHVDADTEVLSPADAMDYLLLGDAAAGGTSSELLQVPAAISSMFMPIAERASGHEGAGLIFTSRTQSPIDQMLLPQQPRQQDERQQQQQQQQVGGTVGWAARQQVSSQVPPAAQLATLPPQRQQGPAAAAAAAGGGGGGGADLRASSSSSIISSGKSRAAGLQALKARMAGRHAKLQHSRPGSAASLGPGEGSGTGQEQGSGEQARVQEQVAGGRQGYAAQAVAGARPRPAKVLRFDASAMQNAQRVQQEAPAEQAVVLPSAAAASGRRQQQQAGSDSGSRSATVPAARAQQDKARGGAAAAAARSTCSSGLSLRSSRAHATAAAAAAAVPGSSSSAGAADRQVLQQALRDPSGHVSRVQQEVGAARREAAGASGAQPGAAAAVPELNSTLTVARQIEDLKAPADQEALQVDSTDVRQLALRAGPLDIPSAASQYGVLQPLQYDAPGRAAKVVPKQLHPGWVASRGARPSLGSLFRPAAYQVQRADTAPVQVLALSRPEDVVRGVVATVLYGL